ncbi:MULTISPECIES: response regulator [Corallincola]|uniref:Response regulator n=2 Tax=Corallincola TaxID=1775176 RepID=A0A368NM80_9GAMM|nr:MULTISPECIES: response regulator [Corallincola]RCU50945.1 response regulator [Corallincola holothuriorum]TAA45899.1 hybrid sensor histidine kinase/response regulator [Corallincola spongiicola]
MLMPMHLDNQTIIAMVVDNMEAMRKITSEQLRKLGVKEVIHAKNGADALLQLTKRRVNIILSDWNMPQMSGFELLEQVKENPSTANIPFILITADAEREHVQQAIQMGVTDLLVKPFTTGDLRNRVIKALTDKPKAAKIRRSASEQKAAGSSADVKQSNAQPTILVVDDTPDNLMLISGLLKDTYRLLLVKDGAKAIEITQSDTPPDLVLLDIMMPKISGYDVLRAMRQHPQSENIPVILITALHDIEHQLKGFDLGAVDYVKKPIEPQLLKLRVRNLMSYVMHHKQLQDDYDTMLENRELQDEVERILKNDLTSPLDDIIKLAEQIGTQRGIGPDIKEKAMQIDEMALHILNMVNLSSELYKVESGQFTLKPKPFQLLPLLEKLFEQAKNSYASKRLMLFLNHDEEDLSLKANADPLWCYSIFYNLIRFACESAPDKTQVSLTLRARQQLEVIINFSGVLTAQQQATLWQKNAKHQHAIGNYTAKLLTEAQSGRVESSSDEINDNTSIMIALPQAASR